MFEPERVREHMPVLGQDALQVGAVDHLAGGAIKLTKDGHGQHHWIPTTWVMHVDDGVRLDRPAAEVTQTWFDHAPSEQEIGSSHH
jgi:hypothetical protein